MRLPSGRITVILDSDGVFKWGRGERRVSAMLEDEVVRGGATLVIPSVVLVEVARAGLSRRALDDVVSMTHRLAPVDPERAVVAASLMDYASTDGRDVGAVDALVAAEAVISVPSIVITSDPSDLRLLCDGGASVASRIRIWRI